MKSKEGNIIFRWFVVMGVFFLLVNSGCGDTPPAGSKIVMPSDTTIETNSDVIYHIRAKVTDSKDNPLNGIEVEFIVCCDGPKFVDYDDTYVKIRTDESGLAFVRVLVPGSFQGEVIVSASIGVATDETKITKELPTTQ